MLTFSGERIVPEADNCEPRFALKMYQEHIARYLFASQAAAGKTVLGVGCGVGYGAQLLAKSGAKQVTAFDLFLEAVRHAREFYSHRNLFLLSARLRSSALADSSISLQLSKSSSICLTNIKRLNGWREARKP